MYLPSYDANINIGTFTMVLKILFTVKVTHLNICAIKCSGNVIKSASLPKPVSPPNTAIARVYLRARVYHHIATRQHITTHTVISRPINSQVFTANLLYQARKSHLMDFTTDAVLLIPCTFSKKISRSRV